MDNDLLIQLLENNNRLIIPSLGAFLKKELPGGNQIVFTPFLKKDDGVLINAIMQNFGIDPQDAEAMINEFVEQIKYSLQTNGNYMFVGIGTLKTDPNGVIIMADQPKTITSTPAQQPIKQPVVAPQPQPIAQQPIKQPVVEPQPQPIVQQQQIPQPVVQQQPIQPQPIVNTQPIVQPQPIQQPVVQQQPIQQPISQPIVQQQPVSQPLQRPAIQPRMQQSGAKAPIPQPKFPNPQQPQVQQRPIAPAPQQPRMQQQQPQQRPMPQQPGPGVPPQQRRPMPPQGQAGQPPRRPAQKPQKLKNKIDIWLIIAIIAALIVIALIIYGYMNTETSIILEPEVPAAVPGITDSLP